MRRLPVALAALAVLLVAAATALGHASLVSTSPSRGAKLAASPATVTLTFNEPVELVGSDDVQVVDSTGASVTSAPARQPTDSRVVQVPLRPGLPNGTYTVRYSIIGADSHVVPGLFVFGVGPGALGPPFFAGASGGPSETSAWGTSSRFLEIAGLGGLIGLLGFRWLVWGPAMRESAGASRAEREAVLTWGRDSFWVGFGILAVGAMLAEAYLLVVQSASVLGTGVWSALQDAAGISQVLGDTRFGSLVQLRGALLFALFAVGAALFIREYGGSGDPKPATVTGPRWAGLLMAGLLLVVLGGIADQGHASVGDRSWLQVGVQLVHIVSVSVWIVGLAMVALVHIRLPAVAGRSGGALATRVLARFSRVALVAVTVAVITGVIRALSELSDPAELWDTSYGRSILWKVALLVPVAALALYNRRIIVALGQVRRPNAPTLALVRRMASAELALSIAIVIVASVLVAQVPAGG